MTWFQIWTVCWQVAVVVTPFLFVIASLWLRSTFTTKGDASAEKTRVDAAIAAVKLENDCRHDAAEKTFADHTSRIHAAEEYIQRPSSQHKLANELMKLQGEIQKLGAEVQGLARGTEQQMSAQSRQMDTLNSYLHTLVEKGLGK